MNLVVSENQNIIKFCKLTGYFEKTKNIFRNFVAHYGIVRNVID